ncbi:MAG: hypothetical protein ACLTDR_05560 [Adlercreutzia equolifaciens]
MIAIGSCAVTGGIPGMASGNLAGHVGGRLRRCGARCLRRPVGAAAQCRT